MSYQEQDTVMTQNTTNEDFPGSSDGVRRSTEEFQLHPAIIYSVICKQAGSLGKAVLESVMNSIDAGGTFCDITLTPDHCTVRDDGRGFRSRQEINDWFKTFGTPHEEGDATYGRFRIGRGQFMSYARQKWQAGRFVMDVDIKNRGKDFDLEEHADTVFDGCLIESELYKRLSPIDLNGVEREVRELVQYAPIPVRLNGEQINTPCSTIQWDHEDEFGYIKLMTGSQVKVYNMGVLVRSYSAYEFGGHGAIIVSKPELMVNFARNDVQRSECAVFAALKKKMKGLANERLMNDKSTARVTDEDRQYLLLQWMSGEITSTAIRNKKLFPLFPNRYASLNKLMELYRSGEPAVVMGPKDNTRIAERVTQAFGTTIFRSRILDMCGEHSIEALNKSIIKTLERDGYEYRQTGAEGPLFTTLDTVSKDISSQHHLIPHAKLDKHEKAMLAALNAVSGHVRVAFWNVRGHDGAASERRLRVGESETALGWTDGSTMIAIERRLLNSAIRSVSGMGRLLHTFIHELVHDDDDTGSHEHDEEFYQTFHDVTGQNGMMALTTQLMGAYMSRCRAAGVRPHAALWKSFAPIFDGAAEAQAEEGDGADEAV